MGKLKLKIRQFNHWRIDAGRALAIQVIKFLFDRKNPTQTMAYLKSAAAIEQTQFKKIIILRIDGKLGDCITSTGFFIALKQKYPDAEITVITRSETEWIYRSLEFLNVITVSKGLISSLRLWWKLKNQEYDLLVNTTHLMKAQILFLSATLNSKFKVNFLSTEYKCFSHIVNFDPNKDHVTVRYHNTLELISGSGGALEYRLPIPENEVFRINEEIKNLKNFGKKWITINCFAGARYRCFNFDTVQNLVEKLSLKFPNHLLVFIANKGDMEILSKWNQNMRVKFYNDSKNDVTENAVYNWKLFLNYTSFYENCRWIQESDLVITPDTSIIHMASAYKIPVVGVYRPDLSHELNSQIWTPYGTKYKIIKSKLDSSKREQDINDLNIDEVIHSCNELLN